MDPETEIPAAWIGRTEQSEDLVTPMLVTRFGATFDRAFAAEAGTNAPILLHFCLCQPVEDTASLGADGHPRPGGFLPPVPLPRRMWAGGDITFHAPLRIGDTVRRLSAIESVTPKTGRSGPLWFVRVRHEIWCDETLALIERQDIVYRGLTSPPPRQFPPAACGVHHRRVTPSPPLLFRYSALTFNSHRIHYDLPYSLDQENYAGLVVHGPLQATLLAQFAADLAPAPLRRFRFRSQSPILGHAPFTLNAKPEGTGLTLWTAASEGPVAMEAIAEW